jgi:hypothetical protein
MEPTELHRFNAPLFRAPGSQPNRVLIPPAQRITSMKQATAPINGKADPETNIRELVAKCQRNRPNAKHSNICVLVIAGREVRSERCYCG